jgi:hypothetical protein
MTQYNLIFSDRFREKFGAIIFNPEDGGTRLPTVSIYEAGSEATLSNLARYSDSLEFFLIR